ncbi:MAG: putative ABC transporter ATP-binding protein YxlF [bacterium ADurb.Bin212]|nr:MAG: putative ABC transporter ATP-binding protein YxlF [bacterium ADurb.Bin212]
MIRVEKISKSFYGQKIVSNLTLSIKKGEVFGFLGPNGAGKTTTIKMLVGLNLPDSGSILVDDNSPTQKNTRSKIGFMPENPYFYDHLTGIELLKFCNDLSVGKHKTDLKFLESTLKQVGLENAGRKMIREYSKGMKQRLGLAQAIIHDPDYIFLDEPLDGLDPIGRLEIKEIVKVLKGRGKTVFFNSHILSDVEEICDEIGIINNGRLMYMGEVDKFRGNKTLEEAFVEAIRKGEK